MSTPTIAAVLAGLLVAAVCARAVGRVRRRASLQNRPFERPVRKPPFVAHLAGSFGRIRPLFHPRSRRRPSADAIAEWCDDLARRARAGATLRDALLTTVPRAPALAVLVAAVQLRLERGDTVERALGAAGAGDDGHLALARNVISTAAMLGGPSAPALDRVAAALRLRSADQQERAAHSAQARMSAHVLTLVPLGFLALMLAIDGGVRQAIGAPMGAALVATGLALNGAGWLWMRAVIGRAP